MPLLHLLLAAWLGGQGLNAIPPAFAGPDAASLPRLESGPDHIPSDDQARSVSAARPHAMAALLEGEDESKGGNDALPVGSPSGPRFVPPANDRANPWPPRPCRHRYSDRSASLRC